MNKLYDEFSEAGQIAFKTTGKGLQGLYHLTSMGTDKVKNGRKKQVLEDEMELQQIVKEAVAKGMDEDIAWSKCAAIDAEI